MRFCLFFLLFASSLSFAADVSPETHRRHEEMDRLAARNAWTGVERQFVAIVESGEAPDREHQLLGAEAARQRGDMLSVVVRMLEAQAMEESADLAARIEDIMGNFGRVQLSSREVATLTPDTMPFRPDATSAVQFAQLQVKTNGRYDGFLPVGQYVFGDEAFVVKARQEVALITLDAKLAGPVEDLTLAGVSFPRRTSVGGERLKLNGLGVRAKMSINVYVAALYLDHPTTNAKIALHRDSPKKLVMEFVFRKVSVNQLRHAFEQDLARVEGADSVKDGIESLYSILQEAARGDRLTFEYQPGRGTEVGFKGGKHVLVEGVDFMRVIFAVYLGDHPPTDKLKRGLMTAEGW